MLQEISKSHTSKSASRAGRGLFSRTHSIPIQASCSKTSPDQISNIIFGTCSTDTADFFNWRRGTQKKPSSFAKTLPPSPRGCFFGSVWLCSHCCQGYPMGTGCLTSKPDLTHYFSDLYHKILMSVETRDCPTYVEHTSQLFQMFRAVGKIDIYNLSLADEDDERLLFGKWRGSTYQHILWRVQDMTRRLNSRTKVLLEVEK